MKNVAVKEKRNKPGRGWLDNKGLEFSKQQEMDFSYTNIDKLVRYSLGENAHFDNALYYNNDYSITLETAQKQKCEFVCDFLNITEGSKVLDLGCGWGGFLKHLKDIKAKGIGVSLSTGQVKACHKNDLEAYVKDMRYIIPSDFGYFDAITAIGSFDHVATLSDYKKGVQDDVYDDFFHHVYDLLPKGGRFYIQTMIFGKNMIPFEEMNINAPKDSIPYICALQLKHHPNSWLPYSFGHLIKVASPYFNIIHQSSGRLDFIETNRQWNKRFRKFNIRKYLWFLTLLPKFIANREFRYQLDVLRYNPNRLCFEKEILDHARMVFEKK